MKALPTEIDEICMHGIKTLESNKIAESIPIFKEAIYKIEKLDNSGYLDSLWHLNKYIGVAYYRLGIFDEALEHYNESLEISKLCSNREFECRIKNSIGVVLEKKCEYKEAQKCFEEAYDISIQYNITNCEANSLNNIALIKQHFGFTLDAISLYLKAFEISKQIGDEANQINILNNLGEINNLIGNHFEALKFHKEALEICEAKEFLPGLSSTLHFIGYTYDLWRRYDLALDFYQRALNIRKKLNNKVDEIDTLCNIATVYNKINNHTEAQRYYSESIRLALNANYKLGLANTLENFASLQRKIGSFKLSKKNHLKALKIYKKIGKIRGILAAICGLGSIENSKQNYNKALRKFNKALKISRDIVDIHAEGSILANIGYVYKLKSNYKKAIEYIKEAFELRDQVANTGFSSEIRIFSRAEQSLFLSVLVDCFLKTAKIEEALVYIEQTRGRELMPKNVDVKTKRRYEIETRVSEIIGISEKISITRNKLLFHESQFRNKIISKKEFEKIKGEFSLKLDNYYKDRLRKQENFWFNNPSFGIALQKDYTKIVESFKRILNPKWILLNFYFNEIDEELIVFFLKGNEEISIFETALQKEVFNEMLLVYSDFLNKYRLGELSDENELQNIGRKMYELFIPNELKVKLKSESFEYITLIPTREMHSLPLELIHDGNNYWSLDYKISRAFNIQTLIKSFHYNDLNKTNTALLVGNPTDGIKVTHENLFDSELRRMIDLSLPHSTEEIRNIKGILEKSGFDVTLMEGKNAQYNNFISFLNQQKYSIIHFAGHGFYDIFNPEISFLLLRENDCFRKFYSNEIPNNIELVGNKLLVLSACETGEMKTLVGDEIIGLARGFVSAGSTGIIITGWPVFDDSAKDFFTYFYSKMNENQDISEALRSARKYVKSNVINENSKKYSDSIYELMHWGPYRYYGLPFKKLKSSKM